MRLLLDTHALVWALSDPKKLSAAVRQALENPAHEIFVSVASAWELAIKNALGKIRFPFEELAHELAEAGFELLPVRLEHALSVRHLPQHHRDPFDRLLIAQSTHEGLTFVSRDKAFSRYEVPLFW